MTGCVGRLSGIIEGNYGGVKPEDKDDGCFYAESKADLVLYRLQL